MEYDELLKLNQKYLKIKRINMTIQVVGAILTVVLLVVAAIIYASTQYGEAFFILLFYIVEFIASLIVNSKYRNISNYFYAELEKSILKSMGLQKWMYMHKVDASVRVKSKQAVYNYSDIKYFKENEGAFDKAFCVAEKKQQYKETLTKFLAQNEYKSFALYYKFEEKIIKNLKNTNGFLIHVNYISPAGRVYEEKGILVSYKRFVEFQNDKSLLMSKGEYNKYVKDIEKEQLNNRQKEYYEKVNGVIDLANGAKEIIVIKNDVNELDEQINSLFDRTVNSIKRIKAFNSAEWDLMDKVIVSTEESVNKIINRNKEIIDYYNSFDFKNIKNTCETLMNTQKDFNEYIDKKVKSISSLFGTKVVRNETNNDDEYNYVHQYKKRDNPFVAELSAGVFASAENNPLDYVVKIFYSNKERYPEQIQKLQLLIEELETLKEAEQIIDNYKKEVQQYLANVPSYVMEKDEEGFYSRLGFAIINESVLTVEYKFSYTSNGGRAQRSFTVPMTEETIVALINELESKITMASFSREQRALMTIKLRQHIKERDKFTCQCCGNSTFKEPNLLLEIDHIIPVSKGGITEENNLQTLCWKCNRQKSNKM